MPSSGINTDLPMMRIEVELPGGTQTRTFSFRFGIRRAAWHRTVQRAPPSDEVKDIRAELRQLKEAVAETLLENRLLKKSVIADGGDDE
jgi:hypothetical protein